MGMNDDDILRARATKPAPHAIGEPLDLLSVDELAARVELLKSEIVRLEQAIREKKASRETAAAFFKT